jgi:hypothetical protein
MRSVHAARQAGIHLMIKEERNLHDSPTRDFSSIAPRIGTTMPNGLKRLSPISLRVAQHCLDCVPGQELGALSVGEGRVAVPVDEGVDFDALVEFDGRE